MTDYSRIFHIGRQAVKLSEELKKWPIRNNIIYLAPANHVTETIFDEFKKLKPKDIKFIDNFKAGSNIIKPSEMDSSGIIFLYSPSYHKEISRNLPKDKLYVLYHKRKKGYNAILYNNLNILKINLIDNISRVLMTIPYKLRFLALSKLNIALTSNEKRLKKLQNIHQGKRAFIIGNGPSLKIDDLNKLKNEITFASNKIYLAYEDTTWRPTYYSVEDSFCMDEFYTEVKNMKTSTKLLPLKHLREHNYINDAIYYPLVPSINVDDKCSNKLTDHIYAGGSVTFSMMQLAISMGIKNIYLIGMDFNYIIPKSQSNSTTLFHDNENNHFHKNYRKKGDKWGMPNYQAQEVAYKSAKKFSEKNGIKIFNASRKTKLDVFEKINFESLF